MATKAKSESQEIEVIRIDQGEINFYLRGTSPIILNRMPEKAWRELIAPSGRKTAADKAANVKHDPMAEFRASAYQMPLDNDPTLIAQIGSAFKKALASAALDLPGASKSQIGRLTFVPDLLIPVYGEPQVLCSIVRSADINHTPDVRTRCILPNWCAKLRVRYVKPLLREAPVINLLAAAGVFSGVGDWRPQKGAGSFGQFELVSADDEEFNNTVQDWGRQQQIEAMAEPQAFNDETRELLGWFDIEMKKRGHAVGAKLRLAA